MIFETLYDSALKGELLLVEDGLAHFHVRKDGQMTLREIIVTRPGCGIGTALLQQMKGIARQKGATSLLAKCPADLAANGWYKKRGFSLEQTEITPSGRKLNLWRLRL